MTAETDLVGRVRAAVGTVLDPELRRPLAALDMIGDVAVSEGVAHVDVRLTVVGCPAADRIERDVREAAAAVPGVARAEVALGVMTPAERAALTERLRAGRTRGIPFTPDSLTRVIAVTSGKGGVGKSSTTANLAVALAQRGLAVGLVDADVHGFSIPGLLGLVDGAGRTVRPTRIDDLILPPVAFGVKVVSIGMFVPPGQPVVWRGPMLHRALQQFLADVFWGDLDVLLLDLPPGTGDIAISVAQLLPGSEIVVVTTPQVAAAEVAARAGAVAVQTRQRVVGVVENMAWLEQPDGSRLELFGSGGGQQVADDLARLTGADVPLLAQVPLDVRLREAGDSGTPVVLAAPDSPAAQVLRDLARTIGGRPRNLAGRSLGLSPVSH